MKKRSVITLIYAFLGVSQSALAREDVSGSSWIDHIMPYLMFDLLVLFSIFLGYVLFKAYFKLKVSI